MAKCKAHTDRFNCGCCEDTVLYCELRESHSGEWHETTRDEGGDRYAIKWRIMGPTPVGRMDE